MIKFLSNVTVIFLGDLLEKNGGTMTRMCACFFKPGRECLTINL